MSKLTRILSVVAVVAVLAALVLVLLPSDDKKYLTASFPRTISLYEGSDVRVLGVPVGQIETVTPSGTDVTVEMSYDADQKIPADAEAVIISPAIVGDRYVQLTPVYSGGEVLADGAEMTVEDTSTPLELDEIYQNIDDLTVALGPGGANSGGALTSLLDSTAENFAGEGEQFNQTIEDIGKFTGTLDNNKEELFGTVRQMERFVSALAENDQTVRQFNQSLEGAASVLEGEREELAAALRNLGVAMREVTGFVRENRAILSENITGLKNVSQILVRQREALSEVLNTAPLALNNLFLTYNPGHGTLDTRANLGQNIEQIENDPALFLCTILLTNPQAGDESCEVIRDAVSAPTAGASGVSGAPRSAPLDDDERRRQAVAVEYVDTSLAGLVEVK